MSKYQDRLNEYPLFFEEIGQNRNSQAFEETKKSTSYEETSGLDEDQLAKLSDDLRTPLSDSSSSSNPLQ